MRKNLAQKLFWNSRSAQSGFGPAVIDPELMELRTLTDPNETDEEENNPDDRKICLVVGLVKNPKLSSKNLFILLSDSGVFTPEYLS